MLSIKDMILFELLGGGKLDFNKLEKIIDEDFDLEPIDIVEIAKDLNTNKFITFDDLMYSALYLAFQQIQNYVLERINVN